MQKSNSNITKSKIPMTMDPVLRVQRPQQLLISIIFKKFYELHNELEVLTHSFTMNRSCLISYFTMLRKVPSSLLGILTQRKSCHLAEFLRTSYSTGEKMGVF